jgi:hypothetical protein
MALDALPPPLVLAPATESAKQGRTTLDEPHISVHSDPDCDALRALTFGEVLAASRARRSMGSDAIEIFVAVDPFSPPPAPADGWAWLPHLFCWRTSEAVSIAWELGPLQRLVELVEADADAIAWWAARPQLLLRLGRLATRTPRDEEAEGHLSVRWLLLNEATALAVLAAASGVEFEHVSLHVEAAVEEQVARILTMALGLAEVPRPAGISAPGRWLSCGAIRIHLNCRTARMHEIGFPGTAPNHVCFAVIDIDLAERALHVQGIATTRAGSLQQPQVWFELPGGTIVELQPHAETT